MVPNKEELSDYELFTLIQDLKGVSSKMDAIQKDHEANLRCNEEVRKLMQDIQNSSLLSGQKVELLLETVAKNQEKIIQNQEKIIDTMAAIGKNNDAIATLAGSISSAMAEIRDRIVEIGAEQKGHREDTKDAKEVARDILIRVIEIGASVAVILGILMGAIHWPF